MIADLLNRQSPETKLKESIDDLKETIKATYQRKVHESVHGGVTGAGKFGESFFSTLGLSGIAENIKKKAEAKEIDRQEQEKFVQNFQDNTAAGQTLTGSTARLVAEEMYRDQKGNSPEEKIENAKTQQDQLEVQKTMSDDITDLYTISDDYFKEMQKKSDEIIKILQQIRDNGGAGGSAVSDAVSAAADLAGAGRKTGRAGRTAGTIGKLGKVARIGGGVLAVGTAAVDAYGDYKAADEAVQRGEISKEEGQVKKGEAVGGGIGAAGGALAGAKTGAAAGAALGSFVPGIGTVVGGVAGGLIGGAAGYFGGKWLGSKVGGTAVKATQTVSGTTPGSTVPSSDRPQKPAEFYNEQYNALYKAAQEAGVKNPEAVARLGAAQSSLETGYGKHTAGGNNFFGIKADKGWKGDSTNVSTREVIGGQDVMMNDKFRKYGSREESARDYIAFMQKNPRYAGVLNANSVEEAIAAQGKSGYATDPKYAESLYKINSKYASSDLSRRLEVASAPAQMGNVLNSRTMEVGAARDTQMAAASNVSNVSAPVTQIVNNTTTKESSKKNNESTFQKYVDRRFYPA